MGQTRAMGMPVRSRRLLDVLFNTLVTDEREKQVIDREGWIESVREAFLEWKKECKAQRGRMPGKEESEHSVALIGLEILAERLMLERGEDIRSRLPEERVWSLLEEIDERDLEVYRRCEIELERPMHLAETMGCARDEILRRWSRARHHLAQRIQEP